MRMRVNRRTIDIIPENPQDEAFIEEVLGLEHGGDCAQAVRIDVMGLCSLAYVTIEKRGKPANHNKIDGGKQ